MVVIYLFWSVFFVGLIGLWEFGPMLGVGEMD
jgi:hypothetical protein